MASPFPGMNPYLEQSDCWQDFHNSFLTHAREHISSQLGPNYLVKVEMRLILHEIPDDERCFFGIADVGVASAFGTGSAAGCVALMDSPVALALPEFEEEKQTYLEIRDRRNRRVITVIELVSPSNKKGEDRSVYVAKRLQIMRSQTHFVEIDLCRGGQRPSLPELPSCDYYALVSQHTDRRRIGFWPIGLRDPLPVLPIPLDGDVPPARLDLKAVLDQTYDAARYGNYIYQETPEPPLSAADEAWAKALIRASAVT